MTAKDAAAVETPSTKSAPLREKVEIVTQRWFDESVRNTPVAQEPRAYAHMVEVALPRLRTALLESL